ncbi:MAG: helix-turn-helix transcriptional regulator [Flavobacteriales bacterium]|nr:helix-turn-helix transcriptional regulator [Flavobacteriales bacterium]
MLGKRIDALRIAYGLPHKRLARELDVSQSTISRMISGKAKVQFDQVVKLSRLFKLPLEAFVTDDPALPSITITINRSGAVVPQPPAEPPGE